jgi:hypothetical protein
MMALLLLTRYATLCLVSSWPWGFWICLVEYYYNTIVTTSNDVYVIKMLLFTRDS